MAVWIDVIDETTAGERRAAGAFRFETAAVTLRHLIRLRVQQEVERQNLAQPQSFRGLVPPDEAERILNGARERRPLDWEKQFEKALAAFRGNTLVVLVDGRQITGLDQAIELTPRSEVTFLQLVPLVGG